MKCMICEKRPAKEEGFCATCGNKINSERKKRKANEPLKFLTYRGHVVGLYPNGGKTLKARLLSRNPERLPKSRTVNLNIYCEGFSREKIKSFKRCVLMLAHA